MGTTTTWHIPGASGKPMLNPIWDAHFDLDHGVSGTPVAVTHSADRIRSIAPQTSSELFCCRAASDHPAGSMCCVALQR
eukprot:SAG11_NODE_30322_length_302_cov_0.625616_1_plen_78_part_01